MLGLAGLTGLGAARIYEDPDYSGDWQDNWQSGPIAMIIPSATHDRFRVKVIGDRPFATPPWLRVGEEDVKGYFTDTASQHVTFDVDGLAADTSYQLQILDSDKTPLTDGWPLKTFPRPDASPDKARFLFYTCMGGADMFRHPIGLHPIFLHSSARQRLLRRALSFQPDAAIALGDHMYWDILSRTGLVMGRSPIVTARVGSFDRSVPLLGTENEPLLKRAALRQIPAVYGNLMRSTPSFFVQDDHDYFENDEATEDLRTFPADAFMLDAAKTTQRLYYPEFLDTTGLADFETDEATSLHFGTLRYGNLVEMLMYDCRRHMDYTAGGHFLDERVEHWIRDRTANSDAAHVFNVPSTPTQWTAGKWGEWYQDITDPETGALTDKIVKPYWSEAWRAQHDRLLTSVSARKTGIPMVISGDLHATAVGRMFESGEHSFADNPVVSALVGSMGTGEKGWPSASYRAQPPSISTTVNAENLYPPVEENGFTLVDIERGRVTLSQFKWLPEQGPEAIDTLEPFTSETFTV